MRVGNIRGGSTTTLVRQFYTIMFSPRRLDLVGENPNRQEGFVSDTVYHRGLGGTIILSGCGEVLGRQGSLLGSVCEQPSLTSALPM